MKGPAESLRSDGAAKAARPRLAVVGAGIVGLAHAWAAARRGWEVLLFDRDRRAQGASIRNFGMVWPIGQPAGELYDAALESRGLWQELVRDAGLWSIACGSLHAAYREDELAVLAEFAELAPALGYDCRLISPAEVAAMSPAVKREGLLGGLWSPTEMCVDPRQVIRETPEWLSARFGVLLHFGVQIVHCDSELVAAADGSRWLVDRVVVATGADFRTLYPDQYAAAGFRLCKLQMMRTGPQSNWKLGPMAAGGLTLRHYEAFAVCESLAALKQRIARETPELDRYGIHVMAAQNGLGEVILGDSHEYDEAIEPFDKELIDELMLRELRQIIELPDWSIRERWHGVYPKAPGTVQFTGAPEPGVNIVIASGGCGMTMSFGLAERQWRAWETRPESAPAPAAEYSAPSTSRS